jgi:hypothetical protein
MRSRSKERRKLADPNKIDRLLAAETGRSPDPELRLSQGRVQRAGRGMCVVMTVRKYGLARRHVDRNTRILRAERNL